MEVAVSVPHSDRVILYFPRINNLFNVGIKVGSNVFLFVFFVVVFKWQLLDHNFRFTIIESKHISLYVGECLKMEDA